jgi:hypothetical protein
LPRAVRAAVELAIRLDAVPDHAAPAVLALRREFVDRTLEAVERPASARTADFEALVVVVTADVAFRHRRKTSGDGDSKILTRRYGQTGSAFVS